MIKFTYKNTKTGEIIKIIEAATILEADTILKNETGFDVLKCMWIACIPEFK